ncbi:telomerase reverse transcriptase-like [Macrotis lagotis]|uniref:telomerase reverse transcriptase-like n=1 Tax=Macrotis lagotis TaxID=92651 RepID=UPI003D694BC6
MASRPPAPRSRLTWPAFRAVRAALRFRYRHVLGLSEFAQRLQAEAQSARGPGPSPAGAQGDWQLLRSGDPGAFQRFVARCAVCVPADGLPRPGPLTFQQLSSQKEVVARIVQRICEKKKKNILTLGYKLLEENRMQSPVMFTTNVYKYHSNIVTETISDSALWERLLSRIGDDGMMYMLEHCSLFMMIIPGNALQISGLPFNELSKDPDSPSEFIRRKHPKQKKPDALLHNVRKNSFHRNPLVESGLRKEMLRCKDKSLTVTAGQSQSKAEDLRDGPLQDRLEDCCGPQQASKADQVGEQARPHSVPSMMALLPRKQRQDEEESEVSTKRPKQEECLRA